MSTVRTVSASDTHAKRHLPVHAVYDCAVPHRTAFVIALLSPALGLACVQPGTGDDEASTSETDGGVVEPGSLIDHAQWQVLAADADPLADHRPELVDCGLAGWKQEIETSSLEVDTNFCNYLAIAQPSLLALEQGQLVEVIFYHFDLVAPAPPTSAHVAILIDGQMLWEQEIAIPGDADFFVEEFASPISAELGSQVVLHVHNHGQNTYRLQDLLVTP
jgi:xanthosine utilization system XapX-like protein